MSDAAAKLARSRQAIVEFVARRERRHDPHQETAQGFAADEAPPDEAPPMSGQWFSQLSYAARTWWRYHPAHMVVDLATPMMRSYARRKPLQLLGISLALGAALTFARPWKLISVTTLLIALLKSSRLSTLLMAALSAADYRKDANRPG